MPLCAEQDSQQDKTEPTHKDYPTTKSLKAWQRTDVRAAEWGFSASHVMSPRMSCIPLALGLSNGLPPSSDKPRPHVPVGGCWRTVLERDQRARSNHPRWIHFPFNEMEEHNFPNGSCVKEASLPPVPVEFQFPGLVVVLKMV